MLASQDFSGGHQRALTTRRGDIGHGQHSNDRLARADIALDQAAHPLAGLKAPPNLGECADLGIGQSEGQVALDSVGEGAGGDFWSGVFTALGFALGHGQLVGQQFIIG